MCGIYGGIGNVNTDKIKILKLYNESRGGDASGFYSNTQGIVKYAANGFDFLSNITIDNCSLLLGHTRFATHGANVDDNAHPFNYGNVTLTHNGVISNYSEIATLLSKKTYIVDSECIVDLIDIYGECELGMLNGSLAIAYTKNDNNLYLYRDDNPLFYGVLDGCFYYSSLKDSLAAIGILAEELESYKVYRVLQDLSLTEICQVTKPIKETKQSNWFDFKKTSKKESKDWFDDYEESNLDILKKYGSNVLEDFDFPKEKNFEELYYDLWRTASKFSYPNTDLGKSMKDLLSTAEMMYFSEETIYDRI